MGNEKIAYTTDYREKFQSNPGNCYDHGDRKAELRKVIDETRRCHFSLGDDKPEYLSNTHRYYSFLSRQCFHILTSPLSFVLLS